MSKPGISIVVPAYNEQAYLPATLDSINKARRQFELATGLPSEVIVVNNSSTDQTSQLARERGAMVVDHAVRNISSVRNAGIKSASYPLIVTMDADCLMPQDGLERISEFMSDERFIGGALALRLITDKLSKKFLSGLILALAERTSGINGAMFCFWKDDALAIGGFDEEKLIAEDAAFAIALRKHGKSNNRKFALGIHDRCELPEVI